MASSVGSVVAIDFKSTEEPIVEKVEFDLKSIITLFALLIRVRITQI